MIKEEETTNLEQIYSGQSEDLSGNLNTGTSSQSSSSSSSSSVEFGISEANTTTNRDRGYSESANNPKFTEECYSDSRNAKCSESANNPKFTEDYSETSSLPSEPQPTPDSNLVCDPHTGQCLPTLPINPTQRVSARSSSQKEDTIHSLTIAANHELEDHTLKTRILGLFSRSPQKPRQHSAHYFNTSYSTNTEDYSYFVFPQTTENDMTNQDIESAIGKGFVDMSHNHFESNALDVLALYIKGQKLLYTEAKTYCEQQLNFLMLPAIFISCVGSIFSFLSGNYASGPLIIASLNGFNAFLLALISYLKLDAKAQAHKTSAYKFDKLESMCEFNSGRFMFFETKVNDIVSVVNTIEATVREIKETNQFILPESIRYEFAFTYSTNVFMLVKKTQSTEMAEIHNLKNCVNYIAKLREQFSLANTNRDAAAMKQLAAAIQSEEKRKTTIVKEIVNCRKKYFDLDAQFNKEIRHHMHRVNKWFITRVFCCDWLKS